MPAEFFEQRDGGIVDELKNDPEHFQENLAKISKEKIVVVATGALLGDFYRDNDDDRKRLFHEWLRWIFGNQPRTRAWWHWLSEEKKRCIDHGIDDRDSYTIKLLQSITGPNAPNSEAKAQFEKEHTSWSYYESYFFEWFLRRYDIVRARQVFYGQWIARYVHFILAALLIPVVVLYFVFYAPQACAWLVAGSVMVSAILVCAMPFRDHLNSYFQSLMPRLAVTTGLGYLFLFSASGLVDAIYLNALQPIWQIAISTAIILAIWLYLMQMIERRVQPSIGLGRALMRSSHLMVMAAIYSSLGLFVSAPVLFSRAFLSGELFRPTRGAEAYLLITAAIALAIGVVVQLVWEERAVTEPL